MRGRDGQRREGEAGGDRLRRIMDERTMEARIGEALFPGEPNRLTLRIRRGFPGSTPGRALVEYEATLLDGDAEDDVTRVFHARFGSGGRKKFGRCCEILAPPLGDRGRKRLLGGEAALALDDPEMILSVFPLDYGLPWLTDLFDPGRVGEVLQDELARLYGEGRAFQVGGPEAVGYRAGRRCTIRYRVDVSESGGAHITTIPIVGKTHCDDRGRAIFKNLEQLWNWPSEDQGARPSITPRPIAYVPEYNVYFQELQGGLSLYEARVGEIRREFIARAGALLGALHTTGIVVDGAWSTADEIALIRKWCGHLGGLCGDLRAPSEELLSRIESRARRDGLDEADRVIAHRDFYDKQVISGAETLRFIDLDTMTMADPAVDVGNFLAHLYLRGLQWDRPADEVDGEAETFRAEYRGVNPGVGEGRVAFYTATTLFRLACLYAYRPEWRGLSPILLEACRRRLDPAASRAGGTLGGGGWRP